MNSYGDLATLLHIAEEAVERGAEVLRARRPEQLTVKGDRDLASDVDLAVERLVRAHLQHRTPDIGFVGEEEGDLGVPAAEGSAHWVLDPIDGTVNFLHGYPLFAIALALVCDQDTMVAVVRLPALDMHYTAIREHGAFAGTRRLRGSATDALSRALVSVDQYAFGPDSAEVNRTRSRVIEALAAAAQRVRIVGASAIDLAWTAEGRQDACALLGNKPWDTRAGVLLAREAGLRVLDLRGESHSARSESVVAVSPVLEPQLMTAMAAAVRPDAPP